MFLEFWGSASLFSELQMLLSMILSFMKQKETTRKCLNPKLLLKCATSKNSAGSNSLKHVYMCPIDCCFLVCGCDSLALKAQYWTQNQLHALVLRNTDTVSQQHKKDRVTNTLYLPRSPRVPEIWEFPF